MSRLPARLRLLRARFARSQGRGALVALGVLLLAGLILRVLVVVAWRPGFLGYPDSSVYLEAAQGKFDNPAFPDSVFFDRVRPAGYPIFLRILHPISHDLTFPIIVQHGLGLVTAVLLFAAVRRAGGSAWLGLVPALIVLLVGIEVFAEHAALTEGLYIFLQSGALYAVLRALDSDDPGWAALAGFLLGMASDVRFLGVMLIPLVALWLLLARRDSLGGKALHVGALVGAAVVMVGAYVYAQREAIGYTGLAQRGGWGLYARVAGFADCSKFTPPAGTAVLCESTPLSQRPGPDAYTYASSPATRAFGYPDWPGPRLASAADTRKLEAFARAVIMHQPLDYLRAVSRDLLLYFFPSRYQPKRAAGLSPSLFAKQLLDPVYQQFVVQEVLPGYYTSRGYSSHGELLDGLRGYERWTRIQGVPLVVLALLCFVAPFLANGRLRAGASLFATVAFFSMIAPVALVSYDARYVIPALGVLGAGAALGGYAVWTSLRPASTSHV